MLVGCQNARQRRICVCVCVCVCVCKASSVALYKTGLFISVILLDGAKLQQKFGIYKYWTQKKQIYLFFGRFKACYSLKRATVSSAGTHIVGGPKLEKFL